METAQILMAAGAFKLTLEASGLVLTEDEIRALNVLVEQAIARQTVEALASC